MGNILLLEDDIGLNEGISLKLRKEGYQVYQAYDIKRAAEVIKGKSLDMIISDVTLPDGDGFSFCENVRKESDVYILFLTALDSEVDTIRAYDLGADDYMTKPFSLMVLLSKVEAVMRRRTEAIQSIIRSGDIIYNQKEMKAYCCENGDKEDMQLSAILLRLLLLFLENPGQVLSKEQILEALWDNDGQFVDENTVPVNISRLRSRIGTDYIKSVRGIGYIWTKTSVKE